MDRNREGSIRGKRKGGRGKEMQMQRDAQVERERGMRKKGNAMRARGYTMRILISFLEKSWAKTREKVSPIFPSCCVPAAEEAGLSVRHLGLQLFSR